MKIIDSGNSTVWGLNLLKGFCKMFSESSTSNWAVLQLPKQARGILQNLFNKSPPQTVEPDKPV